MFNFLGSLASLIGVVFSALAFVFSKRASTAARQARDAVVRQSLVEAMSRAAGIAAEIVMYLKTERTEAALLRVGDLMSHTSYLGGRWEARLAKKSRDNLARAHQQLRFMHEVLSASRLPRVEEAARLGEVGQQVIGIFSEEHGVAIKATETRDEPW
jgi:hypothetical protein